MIPLPAFGPSGQLFVSQDENNPPVAEKQVVG